MGLTRKQRGGVEYTYQVTIPLFFKKHFDNLDDVEHNNDSLLNYQYRKENPNNANNSSNNNGNNNGRAAKRQAWRNQAHKKKVEAYRKTDEKFPTMESIIAHVKSNDPNAFVEYLVNGEEFDAEWHPTKFEITFKVKSNQKIQDFREGLFYISLADAQWESGDDNGWTVKTVPGSDDPYDVWEYGLTNFKPDHIAIKPVRMNAAAAASTAAPVAVEAEPEAVPPPPAAPNKRSANNNNANNNNTSNNNNSESVANNAPIEYVYPSNNEANNSEPNKGGKRKQRQRQRKTRKLKRKNRR